MRQTISALCVISTLVTFTVAARADQPPHAIPAPALDNPLAAGKAETATLAGGCYWGMQEIFEHVKGVKRVVAGFSGTAEASAGADGMAGTSGMAGAGGMAGASGMAATNGTASSKLAPAEAVQITFDPGQISYGQILHIYFSAAHDPTQRDRQTPDVGAEYRSNIFYVSDHQQKIAEAYIAQLTKAHAYTSEIVTLVTPLGQFNRVPEGQQDYYLKHPDLPYIVQVDGPKMAAFKTLFPDLYVMKPVTF
ncbi:MAG TPA: peptide-methionine (S)-S-oxide reductase [Vicinamibacterales bacterium]|jgi:peptide-methionine (S)-S-oxide reductase|nr:peptide-methionine (S)-S-oxide reductase [Vicinamibacterales bacterium]